ncbi:MAG: MFS transporter, partial [Pseudomonadota bacterium]
RTRAIGIWAAMSSLTTAGGPLLGGWLVEVFSWRAVFWINVPIGVVALLLLLAVPNRPSEKPGRFDVVGSVLLACGLLALVAAMSAIGPAEGGSDEEALSLALPMTLMLFVAAASLFAAFWYWQSRTDHPLIPPYVFRRRRFAGLNLATVAIYAGLSMVFFLLPFELVEHRGMSSMQAGLVFLPFTLCVAFLSPTFGALSERVGLKTMLTTGALLSSIGFAWLAVEQGAAAWRSLYLPMTVAGLAFAVLVAPLTAGVMASVNEADEGLASGINNTASRVAQMIGVALASLFITSSVGFVSGLWLASALCVVGAATVYVSFRRAGQA